MVSKTMKKRWAERRKKKEEQALDNNNKKKIVKQYAKWSDLPSDMLIEINNKLSYEDHIRFRCVCKNWRNVDNVSAVLPWLCVPDLVDMNNFSYHLFAPPSSSNIYRRDIVTLASSHTIDLGDYYNDVSNYDEIRSTMYRDGWLYMAVNNSYYLLFSIVTKASFTLPLFYHHKGSPLFLALSTTPDSPDCVFFALHVTGVYTRTVGIFRHGDTCWAAKNVEVGGSYGEPMVDGAVFIRGVLYFYVSTVAMVCYDPDTRVLNVERFETQLEFLDSYRLYGLDGELMLTYYDQKQHSNLCIIKYDWSDKVWVPLKSLGGRSVYFTTHSVYVDHGISSPNKIYVREDHRAYVDEYTLEDGQLLKSCNSESRNWGPEDYYGYTPFPIWVDPPQVLMKKMMSGGSYCS